MRAVRLAFGILRPAAVLVGAALATAAVGAVLVVVAAHRCAQPFPPGAVLIPLAEVPLGVGVALFGPGPSRPRVEGRP